MTDEERLRSLEEFARVELDVSERMMEIYAAELDKAPHLQGNVERVMACSDRINRLKKLLER